MIKEEEVDRQLEEGSGTSLPYPFDNTYTRSAYAYAVARTRDRMERIKEFMPQSSRYTDEHSSVDTAQQPSRPWRPWRPWRRGAGAADADEGNTRVIILNDPAANRRFPLNFVRTAKYTWLSAVPKFLYEQLGRLANFYFFLTGVLFLVDAISPTSTGSRYGQIISFTFVLLITAVKEAYEDYWRHREDRRLNQSSAMVLGEKGQCRWGDLEVGDIIRVGEGEALPADVVLLATFSEDGIVYIETKQLDGESNLKVKVAPQQLMENFQTEDVALRERGRVECDPPNDRLYEFLGCLTLEEENAVAATDPRRSSADLEEGRSSHGGGVKVALGLEQFLPRGCRLRNTEWIHGLIVNTGPDTKISQNLKQKVGKRSTLDKKLDKLILIVIFLQSVICAVLTMLSAISCRSAQTFSQWYLRPDETSCAPIDFFAQFFTYVLLTANLVPLALYVSLEIARVIQSTLMLLDRQMVDELRQTKLSVRTSNLTEECGMVSYLFSDKTGTLTSNEMVTKKYLIDGEIYSASGEADRATEHTFASLREHLQAEVADDAVRTTEDRDSPCVEYMRLLALCNSVVLEDDAYVGTSPDEVALVTSCRAMGISFLGRTNKHIAISVFGREELWELLGVLEFNSSRKRMSVIVRGPQDGKIRIYSKGADFVMFRLLAGDQTESVDQLKPLLDQLASSGLRTLCMCYRKVELEEFAAWYQEFAAAQAQAATKGREEMIEAVASRLETGMHLLGASAIEDRLQEEVPETLQALARAGVRTWMLTGDKQETAINIGMSCGLLNDVMNIVVINEDSMDDVEAQMDRAIGVWRALKEEMNQGREQRGLVLDGHTLRYILKTDLEKKLVLLGKLCKTVLACRVSPKQKTELVEAVRKHHPMRVTMAIGDGANDVGMIQAAHVGVGIIGLEGVEAKLASDFAFTRFRFLQRLLLVHGRWNYKRMAKLSQYVLYKSITETMVNIYFQFFSGLDGQLFSDPLLVGLYNICITAVPILAFAGFERDVSAEYALMFPEIYRRGQQGLAMSVLAFSKWILTAIYHSAVAFFIPLLVGSDGRISANGRLIGLSGSQALTFLIVVLTVDFCLAVYVSSWEWLTFSVWVFFTTMLLWISPVFSSAAVSFDADLNPLWLNSFQEVYASGTAWLTILLCVVLSIAPVLLYKYVMRNYYPHEKMLVQELQRYGLTRADVHMIEDKKPCLPVLERRGVEYPLRDVLTFDVDDAGGGLHDRFNPVIGLMNRHRRMKRTLSDSNLEHIVRTGARGDSQDDEEQTAQRHRRTYTVA